MWLPRAANPQRGHSTTIMPWTSTPQLLKWNLCFRICRLFLFVLIILLACGSAWTLFYIETRQIGISVFVFFHELCWNSRLGGPKKLHDGTAVSRHQRAWPTKPKTNRCVSNLSLRCFPVCENAVTKVKLPIFLCHWTSHIKFLCKTWGKVEFVLNRKQHFHSLIAQRAITFQFALHIVGSPRLLWNHSAAQQYAEAELSWWMETAAAGHTLHSPPWKMCTTVFFFFWLVWLPLLTPELTRLTRMVKSRLTVCLQFDKVKWKRRATARSPQNSR